MVEFFYSPSPSRMIDFLSRIQTIGVPEKISMKFLLSLGFKSNNDRYLPKILRSLGFTDASNTPTERWKAYRNKEKASRIMAEAISEAYSSLFTMYPDAYRKDDEAITNFFTSQSTVGQKAISFMLRTFKALCELADFHEVLETTQKETPQLPEVTTTPTETITKSIPQTQDDSQGITVNINIQITLPETKDNSIYDKIFESLRNNLIRRQ